MPKRNQFTTIAVSPEIRERLEKLKVHPSQPVEEVVERLLDLEESSRG